MQPTKKSIEVCIVNLSSAVLIQTTVSVTFSLQEAFKAINDEIKILSLLDEKFHKEIVILQSISDVGEYTACVVLSELGDGSKCNKENLNPVMRVYFENKIAEKPYKIVMCVIM